MWKIYHTFMRKIPDIKATKAAGRPMANSGGMDRQRKKLRRQVKHILNKAEFEPGYSPYYDVIHKGA
jgi:hypothetical protein